MSKQQAWSTKHIAALLLIGAGYALPAAAVTCPPGQAPTKKGAQTCMERETPKAQLDLSKFEGAQKTEAAACNKANAAQSGIIESSTEITRINASLDSAYMEKKKTPGAASDADIKKWKDARGAEEAKLKTAKADSNAAKKELRAAKKAVKKEGKPSLECA